MRLVTRLVLSHGALAAILLGALAIMLAAVGQIARQVYEVCEVDLATIDEEEDLHRAGWGIEVAARHAIAACDEDVVDETRLAASLATGRAALADTIASKGASANRAVLDVAERYLALADDLIAGDICAKVKAPTSRKQRLQLDEDLTNAWIARLYELHRHLEQKEEAIARTGSRALTQGLAVGGIALLMAWLVATAVARGVTGPLAGLAKEARRVGSGDFSPIPAAEKELDRMRAALAELDALKQQFLASVSHELRTPLGKMREALALLGDGTAGELSERQKGIVAIARRACEAEIRLVSTLLDLGRLRAGRLLQFREAQSFDEALQHALAEERAEAAGRDVEIVASIEGSAPAARLDAAMIERALANVIRNAVSVSRPGDVVAVERTVEHHGPGGEPGRFVRLRVRDQGPGVPPEIRDTIFEPFATHEVPGRQGRVGIGLGLALAREIVRSHGGELRLADPSPGQATFEVWIPTDS
jgi:two-component system sensor histidine kinase GlrK